jgi:predicted aminopeptidase
MYLSSCARWARALTAVVACAALGGCYLLHTAAGQMEISRRSRPIVEVLAAGTMAPRVRTQLAAVAEIRAFAVRELGLPDNDSYKRYADIRRPYVVWNVFAAPEFSIDPKHWCYPIVGCVSYRGYFQETKARRYALQLESKGFDVAVGGVAAYSTLGHFKDPILNTMLGWSDTELAAIIFHELTHQLLYLPSDVEFDEALATAVEEAGVKRWLEAQGRDRDVAAFERKRRRVTEATSLMLAGRDRLRQLYLRNDLSAAAMRAQKRAMLENLRVRYRLLVQDWGNRGPFDSWFDEGINNAHLVSLAAYYRCLPGFERELAALGGDLRALYVRAREWAKLTQAERRALLCEKPAAHRGI